jgi:hypothetical protein
MPFHTLKHLVPDRPMRMRVWRGPFRGARIVLNPRSSLRKVLGLYEYENNSWLEQALHRVTRVLDVGANDGYFTFGCAAAFRRLGINGEIVAFEPEAHCVEGLRESVQAQGKLDVRFEIVQTLVGRDVGKGITTLDALPRDNRRETLIKIDVEGAELEVIAGAKSWMNASNPFVIEVHKEEYLGQLQRIFAEQELKMVQVNQRPLPLLGREYRSEINWWLVSDLGARA